MSEPPEPSGRRSTVRLCGVRAYWLPGVEGICLESALADFANHPGDARLVVSKRHVNGRSHYVIELKKDKIQP